MTINEIRHLDTGDMYGAIKAFPEQWRAGRAAAVEADLAGLHLAGHGQVLVAGMGGSAIGGDLLRTLALESASVPVVVSRSYELPGWVGPETLVVISSYSGNTEETLSAFEAAGSRGATLVCIATGGAVKERALSSGIPCLTLPGGLQPRAALGYSLTALLTLAEQIGLLAPGAEAWGETQVLLEERAALLADPSDNEALDLAGALRGLVPVVYSGEGLLEAVNLRWRNQLQENAKTMAYGNFFPELNHNEIMGWEGPGPLLARLGVILLRDRGEHPRVARRIDVTRDLLAERAGAWVEVESRGTSPLARLLSLVHLGDWVSFYLAMLQGLDPTPIGLINRLKDALASS